MYGGTKAELERLIADASTYTDIQKEMGITVDASSMSFDNIVNAIAVVQGKLGIAGATALEAGTTIEGSVNSMKSAWQNLITGIADDNADFAKLVDNFVTTIAGDGTENNLGVFGNLLPRIEVALEGAVKLIEGLFPKIIDALPDLIETLVPSLIDGAVNIIMALVQGLRENAGMLAQVAVDAVFTLVEGLLSMLPEIIALGLDLIIALANGITKAIQDDGFIQTIIDVVLQIVETLTNPETLTELLNAGLDLLLALVEGLLSEESITALVDAVFLIIENLMAFFYDPENIGKIIDIGVQLIVAIVKGLGTAIWRIVEGADELSNEFWDTIMNTDWLGLGKDIMNSIWDGLVDIWNDLVDWFSDEFSWFTDIWDGITGGFNNWLSGGTVSYSIDGSHAGGLSYVPFDGYIAQLHKGERVLTASEAQRYNNGGYSGGTSTVNVTVGIDDTANAMGLARALLPFLKIAEKEVYA